MPEGDSSQAVMLATVEAMFQYLDSIEEALGNVPEASDDELRSGLGLPKYRFIDRPALTAAFSRGAQVKFVFLGRSEASKRAAAVDLMPGGVPAATVNDPDACRQKGLCFPNRVRQEFRLCGQDVVVARNAAPYGRNHGVVRSVEHEPQALCFEPFRLSVALSVARALGSETGPSAYEVWVAGEGFNTQWHFHVQFRKQRGPIWEHVGRVKGSVEDSVVLDQYPSHPFYFQSNDPLQLIEVLYRQVSTFLPTGQSAEQTGSPTSRPALGLLLAYEDARWKALLVRSWCPRGERVFGKQPGLHEHLGEVVLESEAEFLRVQANPSAAAKLLEAHLTTWCGPRKGD